MVAQISGMSPVAQISGMSPEEIRVEMKRRFDAVNAATEERHWTRHHPGEIKEEKASNPQPKHVVDVAGDDGIGENDSLGG